MSYSFGISPAISFDPFLPSNVSQKGERKRMLRENIYAEERKHFSFCFFPSYFFLSFLFFSVWFVCSYLRSAHLIFYEEKGAIYYTTIVVFLSCFKSTRNATFPVQPKSGPTKACTEKGETEKMIYRMLRSIHFR